MIIGRPCENILNRFFSKIQFDENTSCWNWIGYKDKNSYGQFRIKKGKMSSSHRFSYELFKGDIPKDLTLDHLCRNPPCANPEHLEAVTTRVNVLRGIGPASKNSIKTHCIHGHEFTPENTYITKVGKRHCIMCWKIRATTEEWKSYRREYYYNVIKPKTIECVNHNPVCGDHKR